MTDQTTNVADLRRAVAEFVDARDWRQFHNPKNLAMSIAIEAAELMEHFQWLDLPVSGRIGESPRDIGDIREELADVLCYALSLANVLEIDVSTALHEKLVKNNAKYPAERFRGRFK